MGSRSNLFNLVSWNVDYRLRIRGEATLPLTSAGCPFGNEDTPARIVCTGYGRSGCPSNTADKQGPRVCSHLRGRVGSCLCPEVSPGTLSG